MNFRVALTIWTATSLVAAAGCKQAVPDPEPGARVAPQPTDEQATAAEDGFAVDPGQRFRVPVPMNWETHELKDALVATDVDNKIELYFDSAEGTDVEELLAGAWKTWGAAAPQIKRVDAAPADEFWEKTVVIQYEREVGSFAQAIGRVKDGMTYITLLSGDIEALQKRGAQANVIVQGLEPVGAEKLDLSEVTAALDDAELEKWSAFVESQVLASEVPGAAILLVKDGEVAWKKGFGTRAKGGDEAVTPDTLMMIGSVTKPLTTLVMAELVDEGKLSWSQPVVELVPKFAVKDPKVTEQVLVKHLACACTGVPRRDLELFFSNRATTAEGIVDSLKTFEFFTDFGETFQYSNQMVAMAGYTATAADAGKWGQLGPHYKEMMNERLFEPLDMKRTTLDFNRALKDPNRAEPHLRTVAGEYIEAPVDIERFVIPVAPAGAAWSTVEELGQVAQLLLAEGKTADGKQLVSKEQLEHLWSPTVSLSPELFYGLGWFVRDYHGVRVVHHGGNTFGFTADLTLIPEADVAIVVLSNGAGANRLGSVLTERLLELLYDQPDRATEQARFGWDRSKKARAQFAERVGPVDPRAVAGHLGRWENDELGFLELDQQGDDLVATWGEMSSPLGRALKGPYAESGYYILRGPLKTLPIRLETRDEEMVVILGEGAVEYIFTRKESQ